MESLFQFLPKVLDGFEVKVLCRASQVSHPNPETKQNISYFPVRFPKCCHTVTQVLLWRSGSLEPWALQAHKDFSWQIVKYILGGMNSSLPLTNKKTQINVPPRNKCSSTVPRGGPKPQGVKAPIGNVVACCRAYICPYNITRDLRMWTVNPMS